MKELSVLGIDLAKEVFQLHGNDKQGKTLFKKKLRRNQLLSFVSGQPKCLIAMEACGSAHYWARKFLSLGHEVKLIAPQFVKPFVKANKSDAVDAEAIAEATVRPNMRFVSIKSSEQLDQQSMLRIRERYIGNRTALCNQIRGLLFEHGIVIQKGVEAIKKIIPGLISGQLEAEMPSALRISLADLLAEFIELECHIDNIDQRIKQTAQESEVCKKLQEVPGVGVITATAIMAAVGNGHGFKNGRQFAAWVGLVPRHEGTGGKVKLLGISKRGNTYLRSLLVHGARSVLIHAHNRGDSLSKWVIKLKEKKGWNKAAVALANKNARILWAIITKGGNFDAKLACSL